MFRGNKWNFRWWRATTNDERLEENEASWDVHKGIASVIFPLFIVTAIKSYSLSLFLNCSLYPAVPIIARRLGEDVKCGKTVLPSGCEIFVIPYATHRLEHIYHDPEKFIPERFLAENCEKRNPYAYLPFSAGQRNCIGWVRVCCCNINWVNIYWVVILKAQIRDSWDENSYFDNTQGLQAASSSWKNEAGSHFSSHFEGSRWIVGAIRAQKQQH